MLAAAAVGLWRVAAWARGPVVVLQLLLAALAYTAAFQAGRPAIGLPVLALVLVELYLLATPESRLRRRRRRRGWRRPSITRKRRTCATRGDVAHVRRARRAAGAADRTGSRRGAWRRRRPAAVCDIVVADEDAVFGFTEVKLGILPAVISPFALAKIGRSAARELFLTGARFSAARARRSAWCTRSCRPRNSTRRSSQYVQEC